MRVAVRGNSEHLAPEQKQPFHIFYPGVVSHSPNSSAIKESLERCIDSVKPNPTPLIGMPIAAVHHIPFVPDELF